MRFILPILLIWWTAIAFSCSSCGKQDKGDCEVQYHTSGMDVCFDIDVQPEEVDEVVSAVEFYTQAVVPEVVNFADRMEKKDLSVYFIDENLVNGCEVVENNIEACEDIGGVTIVYYPTDIIRIYVERREHQKCLAYSSFAHELLHVIEHLYLGKHTVKSISDNSHDTPFFFAQDAKRQGIKMEQTLEYIINTDLWASSDYCRSN